MKKPYTEEDVLKVVKAARRSMMLNFPFWGQILASLPDVISPSVKTAATDGFHIYWSPAFTMSLTKKQLRFIMAHEMVHCLLEHVIRRRGRDAHLWNYAVDYVTNEILASSDVNILTDDMVTGPLEGILRRKGANSETAEAIYNELLKNPPPPPPPPKEPKGPPKEPNGPPKEPNGPPKEPNGPPREGEGHGKPDEHAPVGQGGGHDRWDRLTKSQKREVKDRFKEIAQNIADGHYGKVPNGLMAQINEIRRAKVDWKRMLVAGLQRPTDYSYVAPYDMYSPGIMIPRIQETNYRVLVAIDTSGSVQGEMLIDFWSEMMSIVRSNRIETIVLLCDDVIEKEMHSEDFNPKTFMTYKGGGGTNFIPVFKRAIELVNAGWRPDKIIYLTDLQGTFPDPSKIEIVAQTIWAVRPEDATVKPPFGYPIVLED